MATKIIQVSKAYDYQNFSKRINGKLSKSAIYLHYKTLFNVISNGLAEVLIQFFLFCEVVGKSMPEQKKWARLKLRMSHGNSGCAFFFIWAIKPTVSMLTQNTLDSVVMHKFQIESFRLTFICTWDMQSNRKCINVKSQHIFVGKKNFFVCAMMLQLKSNKTKKNVNLFVWQIRSIPNKNFVHMKSIFVGGARWKANNQHKLEN